MATESRLEHLDLGRCHFGDVGLRPLFEALAGNSMLRTLDCGMNEISRECARNVMLPAVRANASLREPRVATRIGRIGRSTCMTM
jgi:hypothetical protein